MIVSFIFALFMLCIRVQVTTLNLSTVDTVAFCVSTLVFAADKPKRQFD